MSRSQLFVGRLPVHVRERDVEQVFEKYGRLLRCDVKYGGGMAYAFVDYDDRRDAEDALRYENGRDIKGQSVVVEWARGPTFRSTSSRGECFRCRRPGHWARDCPELERDRDRYYARRRSRTRSRSRRRRRTYSRSHSRSRSNERPRRSRNNKDRSRTISKSASLSRSSTPRNPKRKASKTNSRSTSKSRTSKSKSRSRSYENQKNRKSPRKSQSPKKVIPIDEKKLLPKIEREENGGDKKSIDSKSRSSSKEKASNAESDRGKSCSRSPSPQRSRSH